MNFNKFLSDLENFDPEVYDRLDTRRSTMKQFAKTGGRLALAAVPFALGGMFKKAYGQGGSTTAQIIGALNFALTLEYLEEEYYRKGLKAPGLIPAGLAYNAFQTIHKHEKAHVAFLQTTITSLGGTYVPKPTFDFTAGGTYSDVFTNFDTFLALSQTYEDTGVRAYKGQAGTLQPNNTVLTAALQIHSVEARHASDVREKRSQKFNDETTRPWITNSSTSGIGKSVKATYAGEENTMQLGIEIVGINSFKINQQDATESFDEPLTMDAVLAIVSPFIVS